VDDGALVDDNDGAELDCDDDDDDDVSTVTMGRLYCFSICLDQHTPFETDVPGRKEGRKEGRTHCLR
jgi:hypothetical protein